MSEDTFSSKIIYLTVITLSVIFVISYSQSINIITIDELEIQVSTDKQEYYLGENVIVTINVTNTEPNKRILQPVTMIQVESSHGDDDPWKRVVTKDYDADKLLTLEPKESMTIFSEGFKPEKLGELRVSVLGKTVNVMILPYLQTSLHSPNIYLNICAPNKTHAGETFTAVFSIVNANPYHVSLPAYSGFVIEYGYNATDTLGEVQFISWISGASINIEPNSRYIHKTRYFSPSRKGNYHLSFKVSSYEINKTVIIE